MVAYAKPQQWKKEESERLRGEGDRIEFIDLTFERRQVVRFGKGRRRQDVQCELLTWSVTIYALCTYRGCQSIQKPSLIHYTFNLKASFHYELLKLS